MKFAIPALLVLGILAVGCATHKPETNVSGGVLNVAPSADAGGSGDSSAVSITPVPANEPARPAVIDTGAAAAVTPAVDPTPTPAPAATRHYTVKKGDTLYRIARAQYGDAKQWHKIAQANPGLSARSLKVGQSIVLP